MCEDLAQSRDVVTKRPRVEHVTSRSQVHAQPLTITPLLDYHDKPQQEFKTRDNEVYDDDVAALYNDADDVTSSLSSSSSSSSPWLSTSHQLVSSRQLSPSTGQPSFPRSTSPPRQPLPDGWIISPQQHQQQQQQPTAESMHVVHNMSGILAFFDKCVSPLLTYLLTYLLVLL